MYNVFVLLSAASRFASDFGDAAPKPSAGLSLFVVFLLIAGWLLSLFIAYLIVRAGVRAGVQVLVEQGRMARELMQAQTALLNQLVKRDALPVRPSADPTDDAAAWDKLRNQ